MLKNIGLTGGIACGKSKVAEIKTTMFTMFKET